SSINPGLVHVSISNFGQTGPYRQFAATDIVGSAMGGHMFLNGDPERGPVRTTAPQAYAQANFQGAVGAMVALYARGVNDGVGQHVDVSMQEAMANAMDNAQATWDIRHVNASGPGARRGAWSQPGVSEGQFGARYIYESSDGWVACLALGGLAGPGANAIIDWMAETGDAGGLDSAEWRNKLTSMQPLTGEERAHVEEMLSRFCRRFPKEDLVAGAQARGAGWAPVFGPKEIVESTQLGARDFWVRVLHEDLGESFVYPGAPFRLLKTPAAHRGRAPHVGEHNAQVYCDLLGLDPAELRRLKMRMVL
ncbi:MAG: CoA transferase, partial [Tepidiformaceae bacterium]